MENKKVSISNGNRKMGQIPSVSLPPIITCKNCATCAKKCYAAKLARIYPTVRDSYNRNLEILNEDRNAYFMQVKAAAMMARYFRFHVSGDIIDIDYLDRMVKLTRECKNTEFLVFTKNYEDVNEYFETHKKPRNLHLIFSLPFTGATIDNPHNLPTAAVILKGQEPQENWKVCGGNCTECACRGVGCWEVKNGETIAFYEH
jgi:ferredoxin